jgi:hypothetical protein
VFRGFFCLNSIETSKVLCPTRDLSKAMASLVVMDSESSLLVLVAEWCAYDVLPWQTFKFCSLAALQQVFALVVHFPL